MDKKNYLEIYPIDKSSPGGTCVHESLCFLWPPHTLFSDIESGHGIVKLS